ncbi:GD20961 [Drosophila simulans]|uniref:GD20961 n=1 Tax=Drosophila simulans TaxID=7240 RepID=B4R0M0_DROSI|nr:GD20961 [Drosophila simulans]
MSHKHTQAQAQGGVTQKDANVRTDVQQKPFVEPDPKIPCGCCATALTITLKRQKPSKTSCHLLAVSLRLGLPLSLSLSLSLRLSLTRMLIEYNA